jgi:hypothetical protein
MNQINPLSNENKNKIYYMGDNQKLILEKEINNSLLYLEKLFQKEEILKFLFKYIEESDYDYDEEDKNLTEEEISKKKDELCRKIKEIFDNINPEIFSKYHNRIAKAVIKVMKEINSRKEIADNPIRKVKIKRINSDNNENKEKYNALDAFKSLINETIYISSFYNAELVNSNALLNHDLNHFYNNISNIEIINNVNGVEKKAKDDEFIKKVVTTKENKGKQFIIDTKNFINETIKEQNNLNIKISNLINEMNDIKEQEKDFNEYCNNKNSYFKDINEYDFFE